MKRILLSAMVLLLAGSALYAVAELPSENQVIPQLQAVPMVCPAASSVLPEEAVTDFATILGFDPVCRADCREDYGACLISTPQYICQALYQQCLAGCN